MNALHSRSPGQRRASQWVLYVKTDKVMYNWVGCDMISSVARLRRCLTQGPSGSDAIELCSLARLRRIYCKDYPVGCLERRSSRD